VAGRRNLLGREPLTDRTDPQLSRRKLRDRSIALVLVGVVLLMPPVAGISLIDGTFGGVPIPLLYVFAVWALLIAGAVVLARPLWDSDKAMAAADPPDDPS
jgi:hypothetical protein